MDKPGPPQSHPSSEYQMHTMSPPPGQQPMMHQQTGHEQPPNYHQPPQGGPHFPMDGQQPMSGQQPMQSPPIQQGGPPPEPYSHSDGSYGMPLTTLGSTSAPVQCPNCGNRGMTNVEHESGGFTHAVAAALCCFICLGCFAYMANSLKDCHHRCSKCGVPLATYHRSGRTELHFRPQ